MVAFASGGPAPVFERASASAAAFTCRETVSRSIPSTLLPVSIEALRRGRLELWEKQMGSALGQLDPESGSNHPREL